MKKLLNFLKAPLTKTFVLSLLWVVPAAFTVKVVSKYFVFYNQYGDLIELMPSERQGEFIWRTFGQTVSAAEWLMFFLGGFVAYLIYKGYITATTYATANKSEPITTCSGAVVGPKLMGLAALKDVLNSLAQVLFILLFSGVVWAIMFAFGKVGLTNTYLATALGIALMVFLVLNGIAATFRFNTTLKSSTPFQVSTNFKYLNAHKLRVLLALIFLFGWNLVIGTLGQYPASILAAGTQKFGLSTELNGQIQSIGFLILGALCLTYLAVLSAVATGKLLAWIQRK